MDDGRAGLYVVSYALSLDCVERSYNVVGDVLVEVFLLNTSEGAIIRHTHQPIIPSPKNNDSKRICCLTCRKYNTIDKQEESSVPTHPTNDGVSF
jgi:hypothetical protein